MRFILAAERHPEVPHVQLFLRKAQDCSKDPSAIFVTVGEEDVTLSIVDLKAYEFLEVMKKILDIDYHLGSSTREKH